MSEVEFPGAIDDEHKNGIGEFLAENVNSNEPGAMIEFMFNHWDQVIDRTAMVDGANQRRLRVLRAERTRQDDEREALDDQITELERGTRP